MYLLADAVVTIECSREKTFDYAANPENFLDWFPGVASIVASNELSAAEIGKKYLETVSVPLRGKRSAMIRVTDATAPQRLVTEGDLRPLLPRMEIQFVDAGQNTCEVRWRMLCRNSNGLAGCTVLPVAGWVMRRRAKIGLRNLKLLLEGGRREVTVPQ